MALVQPKQSRIVTLLELSQQAPSLFRGQDLYLQSKTYVEEGEDSPGAFTVSWNKSVFGPSVLKGTFTFTSPTIYLAHYAISLATLNAPFGDITTQIRSAGIIPLRPDQIFSLHRPRVDVSQLPGMEYAKLVAKGRYNVMQGEQGLEKRPFDLGHLEDPVPAAVYYDARWQDCWADLEQAPCATITDGSYRPRLAFPDDFWCSIVGDNYDCAVVDIVDPPIAPTPATMQLPPLPPMPRNLTDEKHEDIELPSFLPVPAAMSIVTLVAQTQGATFADNDGPTREQPVPAQPAPYYTQYRPQRTATVGRLRPESMQRSQGESQYNPEAASVSRTLKAPAKQTNQNNKSELKSEQPMPSPLSSKYVHLSYPARISEG